MAFISHNKNLTYNLKPLVQFVLRADEAAFFLYGHDTSFVAHWMNDARWVSGYCAPRGRIDWNRMTLSEDMSLRYRIKTVSQQVSSL